MNVLADYLGHSDLYYSLHSLFEKRLKMNLFRPIGLEWSRKGFHGYYTHPTFDSAEKNGEVQQIDGVHHIPVKMEMEGGYYTQKAITYNKFLEMDFDFVVTTSYGNEKIFHDVLRRHTPNTVFIRQIGNIHEKPLGYCKNILLATYEPMPPGINYIHYHPEHYEGYCHTLPTNHKTIKNFANHLPAYPDHLDTWNKCESSLRDFTFKMHGKKGRDGLIPHLSMPQAMKDSAFIWHIKAGGFVARQALASGRPCIVRRRLCNLYNTLCTNLFHDSVKNGPVNCIDLDLRPLGETIKLIRELSQPSRHIEICKATAEKFRKDAPFADEAERIKEWINNLLRK